MGFIKIKQGHCRNEPAFAEFVRANMIEQHYGGIDQSTLEFGAAAAKDGIKTAFMAT
jgi:hypothetical protein